MTRSLVRAFRLSLVAGLVAGGGLAIAAVPSFAQQGVTTGAIAGTVTDAEGQPLANAQVTVTNLERGTTQQSLTNQNGRYVVGLLQPGTYSVRAELPPRPPAEVTGIVVSAGIREIVDLQIQPIEVSDIRVSVAGRPAAVTQSGVVEFVTEQQIDNLPTSGRDFTDFINLSALISPQPEITTGGQFSIGGARTSGTNVQVDGVDANNNFFGENRGSSRLPFTFSLQSIREFQIITNGYDVEFGRFAGGLVNAITKGGTNEHHGSAHLFWRDEALTADNFDGSSPADFQSFQFGGSVSGPIVRDELHYFLSADIQQQDQPVFALTPDRSNIPPATIDQFVSVLSSTYGFDEGQIRSNIGQFAETRDEVALFGRLDWNPSDNHRAIVRVNYSDFDNQNDRLSASGNEALTMAGTFEDRVLSLVGELNSTFGRNVYNTFRIQYSDEERPRPGNSRLPSIQVEVDDEGGDPIDIEYGGNFFGILFANNLEESKFQISDNLTFNLGGHSLKIGTDNIFSNTLNVFWLNGNGFYTFNSLEDFQNQDPGFFLRFVPDLDNPSPPIAEFDTREYAFYIQDAWQMTDDFLLTLGLRYDYTDLADPGSPLTDPEFRSIVEDEFGVRTDVVPNDKDNWGPRASFAWDLSGDERNVVRGGGGLFYGRVPTVLHGNVLSTNPQPLLAVVCIGSATPDISDYRSMEDPDNIPSRCEFEGVQFPEGEFGLGIIGAPQITAWDEDAELPETWKFNLGYERQLGERWRAGVQGIYSRTTHNYSGQDLNLLAPQFTTADGRPVHASEEDFADFIEDRDAANNTERGANPTIDRLFFQTDGAKARAFNLKLDLAGNPTDNLRWAANYALNVAKDNSTKECCTAFALALEVPTAGNPNELGDFGDEDPGAWGPSRTERRHVFVTNAIWSLPAAFQVGLIYRAQSGNPFTPTVDGDINGDGADANDRPFLPDPNSPSGIQFSSPEDLTTYQRLVSENSCLREHVGRIVPRNRCRNPWWHSVDLKLVKGFVPAGNHRFDIVVDLFNVLDGLGIDAGEFTFKRDRLFTAVGYDDATGEVVYRVSDSFGDELPVGFEPFQFRAQLGLQYSF